MDKCKKLEEEVDRQREKNKNFQSVIVQVQELTMKCVQLEEKTNEQQIELEEKRTQNQTFCAEISKLGELVRYCMSKLLCESWI